MRAATWDERARTSPIRDGFISRTHFDDACASLWLTGEFVHIEDLVLHDAARDDPHWRSGDARPAPCGRA
jgi:hypothetical protein